MGKIKAYMRRGKVFVEKTPTSYLVAATFVAFAFLLAAMLPGSKEKRAEVYLPAVPLSTTEGETVEIGALIEGKPAIINAWASWCPFCVHELPDLITLQKEFPDVMVVAVNRNEPAETAKAYLTSIGAEEGLTYLFDGADLWYQAVGGYVMPESVFVYADGRVAKHKRGPLTLEEMRRYAALLLAGDALSPVEGVGDTGRVVGCTEEGQCVF